MKKHFEAMKKAGLSLAIFAFISVLFVSVTNKLTYNKIAENKAMMLLQALNEVVPPNLYNNDLAKSKMVLPAKKSGLTKDAIVYFATKDNAPVAAIFEVTTLKGYSGAIKVLVGINAKDHSITGIRVIQHKETPGLGDKMEIRKSNWVLSFNGKSLQNPKLKGWHVKKDGGEFDQFTGATITPRAIVNIIRSTLLYAQDNLDHLFKTALKETKNDE